MKWSLLLLLATPLMAGDAARIVFSKSFPGSVPAFTKITLDQSGNVDYREAEDDDQPLTFKLTPAEMQAVFDLAAKVDYFKHPLDSQLKVAFMGMKTFRYENGAQKSETKFNYSEDLSAQALQEWFEKMAESAQHRIDLERAAKYDHLGVVKALTLLESAMQRKRLVGVEQYLPMLDRISKNETYMHTARMQAAALAEAIRNPNPNSAAKP
jgi:hypothetical protein